MASPCAISDAKKRAFKPPGDLITRFHFSPNPETMKRPWILPLVAVAAASCAQLHSTSHSTKSTAAPATGESLERLLELARNPYHDGGGMWPYHNAPMDMLKRMHQFSPTQEWLDEVRLSSVRFPQGSASFVSPNGLVLTNHHVGLDAIQKASSAANDYVKNGFMAKDMGQEIPCKGLELMVFMSFDDVTARVNGAAKPGTGATEQAAARQKEIAQIEKESREKTGLRSTVANLYQNGEYWIYRYKVYNDVRLVFAPEQQIAFFGGDPDNFTYPRYDLDFSLFRVYEKGAPASTPHYFKFNIQGAAENELVFVSGNPGSTARLMTVAQLEYTRDAAYPRQLEMLRRDRDALLEYSRLGAEQERQAKEDVFSIENSIKAITGYHGGLLDPKLMERKRAEEALLKASVYGTARLNGRTISADVKNPALAKEIGDPWATVESTRRKLADRVGSLMYSRLPGQLAGHAMTIVRYAAEAGKPETDRLPQFRNLKVVEAQVSTNLEVYKDLDEAQLRAALRLAAEKLPSNDPFIVATIGKRDAAQVARDAVRNTKLHDVEFRKQLIAGGKAVIDASDDPMLVLARGVDPILRDITKFRENEIDAIEREPLANIAKARFAVYGRSLPPDANFTLRLSPGVVKGYEEDTTLVPFKTTFFGLYERASAFGQRDPFTLPKSWNERLGSFDLSTPYNFVNTCDIIGGNSGSPVINKNRELVGLIFDGNIQSLPNRFLYDTVDQRAVAVHSAGIMVALDKVYDAAWIVNELKGSN